MLAAFDSGEILAIDITTLVPVVFILYLACPYLWNDEIKSKHAHTEAGGFCGAGVQI